MNFHGVILGVLSFLIIGIWHPIVIKGEYYFGKRACIIAFALVGTGCVALSLFVKREVVSTAIALFGFSAMWGIWEAIAQEKRVERGWFPKNPRRRGKEVDS